MLELKVHIEMVSLNQQRQSILEKLIASFGEVILKLRRISKRVLF